MNTSSEKIRAEIAKFDPDGLRPLAIQFDGNARGCAALLLVSGDPFPNGESYVIVDYTTSAFPSEAAAHSQTQHQIWALQHAMGTYREFIEGVFFEIVCPSVDFYHTLMITPPIPGLEYARSFNFQALVPNSGRMPDILHPNFYPNYRYWGYTSPMP